MFLMGSSAVDKKASENQLVLNTAFAKKITGDSVGNITQGLASCINSQYILWVTEDQDGADGNIRTINFANASGEIQKRKKLVEAGINNLETRQAISDSENTYVLSVRNTSEIYVTKISEDGENIEWSKRSVVSGNLDSSTKPCVIAQNTNNIFLAFYYGSLGAGLTYILSISKSDGSLNWHRRFGNSGFIVSWLEADDTGVYISDINNGFIVKVDTSGTLAWQWGTDFITNQLGGIALLDESVIAAGVYKLDSTKIQVIWMDKTNGTLKKNKVVDNTASSASYSAQDRVRLPMNCAGSNGQKAIVCISEFNSSSDLLMCEVSEDDVEFAFYNLDGASEKYYHNLEVDQNGNWIIFGSTDDRIQFIANVEADGTVPARFNQANDYAGDYTVSNGSHSLYAPTNSISSSFSASIVDAVMALVDVTIDTEADWIT